MINVCEEKKKYHYPRLSFQSLSDVHVKLNFTVMSVRTKKLEVFILHDLCCEVLS